MKSKNKKDLIDENKEEVIEIQRRIRVKISDPDATDSSSDDEKQEKRPKIIVHEIIQEKVKIQSFSLNSKNPLDFYQFYGKLPPHLVRKRECGKFQEKAISAKSGNPPLMVDSQTSGSSKGKGNPLSFDQSSGKLPPMVRKRKSGKFATEIRDPFSKKRIWLGTFNTPEEASKVYQSKKLEFQERLERAKNAKGGKKAISAKFELGSSSSRNPPIRIDSQKKDSSNKSVDRLKKAKNAKGKKVISARSELGSACSDPPLMVDEFDEPLKKAMNAKGKKGISAKFEFGSASSDPSLMVDEFDEHEPLKKAMKKAKNAKGKKGISAKSEFGSASSDPPLLVDEFDEPLKKAMKKAMNAKGKKGISAKSELGSASSDPPLMMDEFDELLKKAINAKVEKDISAKSELVSSSSDQVDAQTSDSSNGVGEKDQESDEELWMGQWIQISGDQEVKFSRKLGVPVVDNYGFLLGEFSKLDDLSISV